MANQIMVIIGGKEKRALALRVVVFVVIVLTHVLLEICVLLLLSLFDSCLLTQIRGLDSCFLLCMESLLLSLSLSRHDLHFILLDYISCYRYARRYNALSSFGLMSTNDAARIAAQMSSEQCVLSLSLSHSDMQISWQIGRLADCGANWGIRNLSLPIKVCKERQIGQRECSCTLWFNCFNLHK